MGNKFNPSPLNKGRCVRWLGAFNKQSNLSDSIKFEFERFSDVAAEKFHKKTKLSPRTSVGLLIKDEYIYRSFECDVYSVYSSNGHLKPTREYAESKHKECFVKARKGKHIKGFVVKKEISRKAFKELKYFARVFKTNIYRIEGTKLFDLYKGGKK